MQQTQQLHIKISFNEEIRRFALDTVSFSHLESTIRELFKLGTAEYKIRYLDDEGDWVTISNDNELSYAHVLSNLLKLTVTLKEGKTEPTSLPSTTNETPKESTEMPCRGRGGRGRGRGGRGCGQDKPGKWNTLSPQERLDKKSSRLTERINALEEKIKDESIPKDRLRVLLWRLQHQKEKLETVNTHKATLESGGSLPDHFGHGHRHGRGQGGRGGRGRCGRGRGWKDCDSETKCEEPESTPCNNSVFECKQNLINARKSGNKDEIDACIKALKEAKQERKNNFSPEKRELLKAKRTEVHQCRSNLTLARQEGRKDDIPALMDALKEAKDALRATKFDM